MTKLIITLGDPHSINIELVSKLLQKHSFEHSSITLVGSLFHWKDQTQALGLEFKKFQEISSWGQVQAGSLHFFDIGGVEKRASLLSTKERGFVALESLRSLESLIREDKSALAILTCPIDKFAAREAGFHYPGHTEFFTELSQCKTLMLLAGPRLRVGLATNHLALRDVSKALTSELIQDKLAILYKTLQDFFHIPSPRIAVCGMNPHCSDGGIFGDEEERIIKPAILKFQKALGPFAADTIFYRALHGAFDAVLAIYHDQGLGPLKTVHFDEAVNITCGLPYLRLSPDHGPAKDLFLEGKGSLRSMEEALRIAQNYLGGRKA